MRRSCLNTPRGSDVPDSGRDEDTGVPDLLKIYMQPAVRRSRQSTETSLLNLYAGFTDQHAGWTPGPLR